MALSQATFFRPEGRLTDEMFPDMSASEIAEQFTAWLDQSDAETAGLSASVKEAARIHYVYSEAYLAIYLRMSNEHDSVSISGALAVSKSASKAERFYRLHLAEKAQFSSLAIKPEPVPSLAGSVSVPTRTKLWP